MRFKKFLGIGLAIVSLSSVFNSSGIKVHASEIVDNSQISISMSDAENIAVNHIMNVMISDDDSKWNEGVRICERKAIFNQNDELSQYYFGLANSAGESCGYVITGANSSEYPIIEYSDYGESFIDMAFEDTVADIENEISVKEEYSKIYYYGDMFYSIEHTLEDDSKEMYDISTSNYREMNKNDIPSVDNSRDNYYSIMEDFSSGGVCAPTAATNLCKYWYYRDTGKYIDLFKNAVWEDVFLGIL